MKTKMITSIILIITLAFWVIWDIYVAHNAVKGDTISEITLATSYIAPFIAAAWGVIMGHLFWPMKEITNKWQKMIALGIWGAILLTLTLFQIIPGNMATVPILFISHFVLGHFLWPQKIKPEI